MRRDRENAAAFDQDVACDRRAETTEAIEQRCLARTVRPDQTEQLARPEVERHAIECHNATKADREIADREQRLVCRYGGRSIGRTGDSAHRLRSPSV